MTIQIPEKLIFQGQALAMTAAPLTGYLNSQPDQIGFAVRMSCLWRGYVGTWSIQSQRLFLTALDGTLSDGSPVTLNSIFPGYPGGVFAHWYSGRACCPHGKFLRTLHGGFEIQYEYDLFLDFDHGVLLSTQTVHNGVAAAGETRTAGLVPAATVF